MTAGEFDVVRGRRIAVVLPTLELGGAERQAILLARYLRHTVQANVHVWGFRDPGRAAELCDEYRVPWRILSLPDWPKTDKEFLKVSLKVGAALRREKVEIVLPYLTFPCVFCGLTWRWTGARLCIWNQRHSGCGEETGLRTERWAVRLTPWFISNSAAGAEYLGRHFGVRPGRVAVIHNGIELPPGQDDRAAWRRKLGVDESCLVACMVANVSALKDHITLVRAWEETVRRLAASGKRAVLVLAGRFDGAYEFVQALVRERQLSETVRFLGKVKDIPGLLRAVDIGVYSSRSEGLPNGVLECMAAGLPVAATDIPGIREAIGPDGYSCLAPAGEPAALADRIGQLVADATLRKELGAQNRQRVETHFGLERMCRETAAFIARKLRA